MCDLLLIICLLAASPSAADRLDVLHTHLDRLRAIPVAPDAGPQAQVALRELEAMLDSTPGSDEAVDRIYIRMDEVRAWLLANAAEKPSLPRGRFCETGAHWELNNDDLLLTIAKEDLSLTVKTEAGLWQWAPSDEKDIELRDGRTFALMSAKRRQAEAFHTGFSIGMRIGLEGFEPIPRAKIDILVHLIGREVLFEIVPVEDIANLSTLAFPKALETGNAETDLAVIPRMQGILLPGNWPQEIRYRNLVNSRELYMPWWGQVAGTRGVQTLFETTDDAGAEYVHPSGGPTQIQPLWYSSLNLLRYPRVVRYVFDDRSSYVQMAKRYRRLVKEKGLFVSLAEKRVRTPNLEQVVGRPVVHIGALYHSVKGSRFFRSERMEYNHQLTTFDNLAASLRELKKKGISKAYVHLDGWGYYGYDHGHPDVIPPGPEQGGWEGLRLLADTCDELGYLLAVHDQYRDFYFSAASFDDKLSIRNWDGSRTEHAEWAGGRQTYLSPRFAPGYVRRNHDAFADHGIKVRGAYLDVFAVNPLEESYQRSHLVTRSDCARYRRECFDLLRARGYVVSSEEPADYLVPSLDLVHHGPYPTLPKGYGPGIGIGIAVPLFNLVYHDSILLPWHITDDGGWGIPKGDAGWLHCILNAGLPYVSPGAGPDQIARVRDICAIAQRLGTLEMVDHEFLDSAHRIQRTVFSDGTQITVDFDKRTYSASPGESGTPRAADNQ